MQIKACAHCGAPFEARHGLAKYCPARVNPRSNCYTAAERIRSKLKRRTLSLEQRRASGLVWTEIWAGRLKRQPCEVCGKFPADAHHDDYSKPLDVRWLCRPHHRQHHVAIRRQAA